MEKNINTNVNNILEVFGSTAQKQDRPDYNVLAETVLAKHLAVAFNLINQPSTKVSALIEEIEDEEDDDTPKKPFRYSEEQCLGCEKWCDYDEYLDDYPCNQCHKYSDWYAEED